MSQIEFYGVRGSIPAPLRPEQVKKKFSDLLGKVSEEDLKDENSIAHFVEEHFPYETGTIGGNSSCVRMHFDNSPIIICDAGTGIRELSANLFAEQNKCKEIFLFMSHTHWDHIMGFPFFGQAYVKGYHINILGCHGGMKERFMYQQHPTHFPISLEQMSAEFRFVQLKPWEKYKIGGVHVVPVKMDHPGDSYAYVFYDDDSKVVYSTDSSYDVMRELEPLNNPLSNSDVLIFDAMFAFSDYIEKLDWGHSNSFIGIDYAVREKIKHLVLFHHDPAYDDLKLKKLLYESRKYAENNYPKVDLKITLATEGEKIHI